MEFRKFPRKPFHSHLTLQQPRPVVEVCSDLLLVRTVDLLIDSKRALVQRLRLLVLVLRRTVTLYSQLGSGSGRVGTGDDAGDGTRLFS